MTVQQAGVRAGMRAAAPLLASVAGLMLGLGLLQSLLGVRATIEGYAPALTGVLMSSYYVGFLAGSVWIPRVLADVGHIRAFAALASLASAAFLLHGVFLQPAAWAVMRLVTGVCISGLTVVIESWLNGAADEGTRGQILSVYMVLLFGGLAGGQLLLNVEPPEEVGLFVLASVLVSVAVVPISLARHQSPVVGEETAAPIADLVRAAPVAAVTAVAAGMAHGALLTIGAVYATAIGLRVAQVAGFMAAGVAGGMVLQIPMGRLSDRIDRREVIALSAALAAAAGTVTAIFGGPEIPLRISGLAAALGAFSFPLYSLAIAHLNDRIERTQVVAAGAKLVLAYGVGAVIGPVTASALMGAFSPAAFMWFFAGIHGVVAIYALFRLSRWSPLEVKGRYAPLPAGATSAGFALASEEPEDVVDLERSRSLLLPETDLLAHERGEGEPVVFVHDAGSSQRVWAHPMRALSLRGFRTISYDLRGHGGSQAAHTYRLHDHVDDLDHVVRSFDAVPVHLVGLAAGAAIALSYARTHATTVRSLTLVSCGRRVVSSVNLRLLASRTTAIAESTLAHLTGRRTHAHRLARTVYDPEHHSNRFRLIAEDVVAAQPRAVSRTYAEAVRSVADVPAVPTLVVLGDRDPATQEAVEMYRRTFGSDRVRIIEGAGHFVPLDNPLAFEEALAGFLASARAGAGQ